MAITLEQLLERDGRLVYKTKGISMLPMLHQNRDLVIIEVPEGRLQKYDVALYKRGTSYVLHRVMEAREGYYLIRGDNTYRMEHVPDSAVIGVLKGFVRKGKSFEVTDPGYQRYVRFWTQIYPLRRVFVLSKRKVRRALRNAAEKLGLLPLLQRILGRK